MRAKAATAAGTATTGTATAWLASVGQGWRAEARARARRLPQTRRLPPPLALLLATREAAEREAEVQQGNLVVASGRPAGDRAAEVWSLQLIMQARMHAPCRPAAYCRIRILYVHACARTFRI